MTQQDSIGKLPPEVLQQAILNYSGASRPEVLVGPGIGEDAALIDWPKDKRLVVCADPIVGAEKGAGHYLVQVNANDIACKGGDPAFLVVTLIVPVQMGRVYAASVMKEVDQACRAINVAVVGGHTELTDRYDRPVVMGTMIGTTDYIMTAESIQPGDRIIATKHAGLEGMAILAGDRPDMLRPFLKEEEIAEIAQWVQRLSVLEDSRCLRHKARFFHDPTEGGFLGGLSEISRLGKLGIQLDFHKIPVHGWTKKTAQHLGFDALKLISSGMLLAVMPPQDVAQGLAALAQQNIEGVEVGVVTEGQSNWSISTEEELWRLLARP